jgi:Flp pilus assembly protein TadG
MIIKKRRGSQAVEFALILPILLSISSGIIDYGWYFSQRQQLLGLVNLSARAASTIDSQASDISPCEYIQQNLNQILNESGHSQNGRSISTQIVKVNNESRLTVTLNQNFSPLFGLVTTPQDGTIISVYRLEDQNWEGC